MVDPTQGIVKITIGENEGQYAAATVNGIVTAYGTKTQDNIEASGVLIAPDEVLTAAHVVLATDGGQRTYGMVTPGYTDGSKTKASYATSNVHYDPGYVLMSDNTAANVSRDFAVIHLSTPDTTDPVFSLASLPAGGIVTVSGYPSGLGGDYDSLQETVTPDVTAGVLDGTSLGRGADPRGSSGGPAWAVVNDIPYVYADVSGSLTTNQSMSVLASLTTADIAKIQSWITADHPSSTALPSTPVTTAPTPTAATPTPITKAPTPAVATPTPVIHAKPTPTPAQVAASRGISEFVASSVSSNALFASSGRAVIMSDVATAIAQAVSDGGDYRTMLQDAGSWIEANSSTPRRALAYLGGLLQGASSGRNAGLFPNVNSMFGGGVVMDKSTAGLANAGFSEGASLHPSITTLATAISSLSMTATTTVSVTDIGSGLSASTMLVKNTA